MKRNQCAGLALAAAAVVAAGAQSEVHGRGWKPLPPTAHVVVTVLKGFNGKPLANAAVVFHAVRNGKNDGNLEVKTNEEGQAAIDVIEIGSHLTVQVIASGFATSANELDVDGPAKELEVKMLRPRAQVSVYQNNDGKAATEKPGVQEPAHPIGPTRAIPKPATTTPPTDPTKPTAEPPPATPPPGTMAYLAAMPALFPQTPTPVAPASTKAPAATIETAIPQSAARPSATPLGEPPVAGPRRVAPSPLVQGTASPLSVTAPVAKPLNMQHTVSPTSVTQRAGARSAVISTDATPLSTTQRSVTTSGTAPAGVTSFQAAPPATAPEAAAPTPIALPRSAITPADATTPAPVTPPVAPAAPTTPPGLRL